MMSEALVCEFEQIEHNGRQMERVDGYRGEILSFLSITDHETGDKEPHAIVLQTFPSFGEILEIPLHKLTVMTLSEIAGRPCLRVI